MDQAQGQGRTVELILDFVTDQHPALRTCRLTCYQGLDPFLGLFTGFLAYYLNENHPRTGRPDGEKLANLLRWKYGKYQQKRAEALVALENAP